MDRGKYSKTNKKTDGRLSSKSAAIIEEVLPGYDEYLLLLQEKNRLVKKLRKKDKKQVDLERKEQGFSLYVNGANAELQPTIDTSPSSSSKSSKQKLPRTAGEVRKAHGPLTHRDLEFLAKEERERMREKQRAKTAPTKTRRKNWNVESIELTTEKGANRRIHAPEILTGRYEEDFESDNSSDGDMEIDAANHTRPTSPRKTSYVKKKATEIRQEMANNRMTLSINDVKKLRQSLEMNGNIKQSLAMEISSVPIRVPFMEDSSYTSDDNCIEEIIQDESEDELAPTIEEESDEDEVEEELISSVDSLNINNSSEKKHNPLKPGETIVLEFAPNAKQRVERNLSTVKRKENDGPLLSARKSSESLISPRSGKQVILNETKELQSVSKPKKQLHPISANRKSSNGGKDSQEEAAAVLAALRAENAQAEKYTKEIKSKTKLTPDKVVSKSPRPSALSSPVKSSQSRPLPVLSTSCDNGELTDKRLSDIVEKVLVMPPKQQCRLVKLLEKLDDDSAKYKPNTESSQIYSSKKPLKAITPVSSMVQKQTNDSDIEVNIEILSNWGHPSRLGLTEIQFYNQDKQLIPVNCNDVTIHGGNKTHASIDVLFNGKAKTTKERYMWLCDFSGKRLEFVIPLKNPFPEKPFELSTIKLWNWNKSINGLDMGGKHVRVFVGGELVYDGDIDKGCGNHIYDYSTSITVKNNTTENKSSTENGSKTPSRENSHHTFRSISRSSLSSASSSSSSRPVSATQPQQSPVRSETRTVLNSDNKLNRPVISGDGSDSSPESDQPRRDPYKLPEQTKCKTPRKSKRLVAKLDGHSSETESSKSVNDSNDQKPPRLPTSRSNNSLSGSSDNKLSKNRSSPSPTSSKPPTPRRSAQHTPDELDFEPEDLSVLHKIKDMKNSEGSRRKDIPKWLNREDFSADRFEGPPESRGSSRNDMRSEEKARSSSRKSQNKASEPVDDLLDELDDALAPWSTPGVSPLRNLSDDKKTKGKSKSAVEEEEDDLEDTLTSPMERIERNRSRWREAKNSNLEESWGSLSFFNRSQRGRLSVDMADDALDEYLPSSKKPVQLEPTIQEDEIAENDDEFTIPELPYGRELVINISSTWGDHHYVGLTGVEIFSSTGDKVQVTKVTANPSDINILPEYCKDPRVVTNIIDGVNRTRDDVHMWLTPFTQDSNHYVYLTFNKPCRVALIRVWNYNKSRIHSYRGAKDVVMKLDGNIIFKGEIARACGGIEGGTEAFGDTILFTTEESILEEVSKNDEAFEGELFSDCEDEDVPFERPSTADNGEERPFTRAVGVIPKSEYQERPETSYITTIDDVTAYKTRSLELNFTATWGDPHYLGLTALEVVGKDGEALPLKLSMLTAQPRDVRILPGHERDDRTLDKLIDGTAVTMLDEHMWLIPFAENKNHLLTIKFPDRVLVTGLRIWNYNKSREDTYRGAKIVHVKIDGRQVSPPSGFLIRKGPGSCHFDYAQEINFTCKNNNSTDGSTVSHTGGVETSQDYEAVQMPCGFIYQFQLFSTWADPYYVGLNGIELYDASLKKIPLTDINISAYPDSVNVLDNVQNDIRTPDKLIDDENDTTDGKHMWLAPILPSMLNRVYVIFDQPTTISMIKIWNYSKTPGRCVKDFALLVDDLLVYNGTLEAVSAGVRGIIPTCTVPQKYHTILFTQNPDIVRKEKNTIINNHAGEQDVQLLNDKKIITKYSDPKKAQSGKPVNQELRPKTSVTARMKGRR
ncbi:hypothetical protein SNE40_019176 [Patella caerulea]|uniref:KATNIP domain-containing protein n=1 Tax=Patella caerulea TaxID=87958 RepID=A0AAN8J6L4_PATCE